MPVIIVTRDGIKTEEQLERELYRITVKCDCGCTVIYDSREVFWVCPQCEMIQVTELTTI